MGSRGKVVTAALLVMSLCDLLWAVVVALLGNVQVGTYMLALGCFVLTWAVYLEVYSHRG